MHFRKIEEINNRKTISHANTFYFGPFPLGVFLFTLFRPPFLQEIANSQACGGPSHEEGVRPGGRDPRRVVGTMAAPGPFPVGLGRLGVAGSL